MVSNSVPAVLFISHDARRHGAQLLLLHLVRWLRSHTTLAIEVLCRDGGELVDDFQAVAPTWMAADFGTVARIQARIRAGEIGLVYANTIANGLLLDELRPTCPVIAHIHELDMMIRHHVGDAVFEGTRRNSDGFVAVSEAVRLNLIRRGIPDMRISVIREFIPFDPPLLKTAQVKAGEIRKSLGIPSRAFVVGGCGTTDWRKGPDLFIQLARVMSPRVAGRSVEFVWLGGDGSGRQFDHLDYDVRRAGLHGRVRFLGERHDPPSYFAMFDAFALTSREDPYPLVMLEAGVTGIPIVCFADSGGAQEFVGTECGFTVPYLDVNAMADRLEWLAGHELERLRLGQQGFLKVRSGHTVDVTGPKVLDLILSQFGAATRRAA